MAVTSTKNPREIIYGADVGSGVNSNGTQPAQQQGHKNLNGPEHQETGRIKDRLADTQTLVPDSQTADGVIQLAARLAQGADKQSCGQNQSNTEHSLHAPVIEEGLNISKVSLIAQQKKYRCMQCRRSKENGQQLVQHAPGQEHKDGKISFHVLHLNSNTCE